MKERWAAPGGRTVWPATPVRLLALTPTTSVRISICQIPGGADYATSRRIVRTMPAASGIATQKTIETMICGT